MQYSICVFDKMPQLDELPVAKIINFPDSKDINDNIYAQGRICYVKDKGLFVRLWMFQAPPIEPQSQITFKLVGDKADLTIAFSYSGVTQCFVSGKTEHPPTVSFFESEDLQGDYWGGQFILEDEFLKQNVFNKVPLQAGDIVKGNIITFVETKGCLFKEDVGEFKLVNF